MPVRLRPARASILRGDFPFPPAPKESVMLRRGYLLGSLAAIAATAVLIYLAPLLATERKEKEREASKSPTASQLPISQVVLFSSGVGYFQREGQVDGTQRIDLTFATQDINDLIKSMTLRDMDGGHITAVSYDSNLPLERTLQSYAVKPDGQPDVQRHPQPG